MGERADPTLCKQDGDISSLSKSRVGISEITLGCGREIKTTNSGASSTSSFTRRLLGVCVTGVCLPRGSEVGCWLAMRHAANVALFIYLLTRWARAEGSTNISATTADSSRQRVITGVHARQSCSGMVGVTVWGMENGMAMSLI